MNCPTQLNRFLYLTLASFLGASLLILGFVTKVSAADISLVVSPPRTDINMNPGETVQKTIKLTNNSEADLTLSASAVDFIVQDNLGTPIKVSENASGRFLASPWFNLSANELTVPAKETVQLSVIITAPIDALPGGHYAGIYFEPNNSRDNSRTVSYTTSQVGSLFSITIAGDINYDAVIKDFSTKNYVNEFGPIDFSLTTENQSDTHISPTTSITIYDFLGRKVDQLNLDSINIFPFTSRTQSARWEKVWGMGRYHATVQLNYGSGQTTSRDLSFWLIPYRLIAAIIIVILVLLAIFISVRRHLIHRLDSRDETIDELKRRIIELENSQR